MDYATKSHLIEELQSNTELSVTAFDYLMSIVQGIVIPTPEEEAQIKNVYAAFAAGLEGLRNELGMPWDLVNRGRIDQLAKEIADFAVEWNVNESFLVGTFLAASARAQLRHDNPEPPEEAAGDGHEEGTPETRAQTIAALAVAGNQNLKAKLDAADLALAKADDAAALVSGVLAGRNTTQEVLTALGQYAAARRGEA